MGVVFRANHAMLWRSTAIKLLPPEKSGAEARARFEQEVQHTSRLTHPNTVAIYDYGRTREGVFYYAMEYLDGLNLEQLVRRFGAQPSARVVHLLKQVCASLAEAHATGLVHRDVKPANLVLCERWGSADVVKVVDFGLVRGFATSAQGLPDQSLAIGTPMAQQFGQLVHEDVVLVRAQATDEPRDVLRLEAAPDQLGDDLEGGDALDESLLIDLRQQLRDPIFVPRRRFFLALFRHGAPSSRPALGIVSGSPGGEVGDHREGRLRPPRESGQTPLSTLAPALVR